MHRTLRSANRTSPLLVLLVLLVALPCLAAPEPPAELGEQARLLYRVAACAGEAALPPTFPARLVDGVCRPVRSITHHHMKRVIAVARPFIARLRPAKLPPRVVYPFGGGDLLYALTSFPDASEITTLSLERGGDARAIERAREAELRTGLADAKWMIMRLMMVDYSFTTHMTAMEKSPLPNQIVLALAALAAHRLEPVSLRYFRVEPGGSLHYFAEAELAREGGRPLALTETGTGGRKRRPEIPEVFSSFELGFRAAGGKGPVRIYRHLRANVDDQHLRAEPGVLRHLEAKGRIAAITKAASYLLWRDDFSLIRGYLLRKMDWMISDSTGVLPRHATAAGFVQDCYGRFKRSLLGTRKEHNLAMGALWRGQPHRPLPFSFGYPDFDNRSPHLLVTRRTQVSGAR